MIRTKQDLFLYKLMISNKEVSTKEMSQMMNHNIACTYAIAIHLVRRNLITKRTIFYGKGKGRPAFETYYKINPEKVNRLNEIFKEELTDGG